MKESTKYSWYVAGVAILLLFIFQLFFLNNLYQSEKRQFIGKVNMFIQQSVDGLNMNIATNRKDDNCRIFFRNNTNLLYLVHNGNVTSMYVDRSVDMSIIYARSSYDMRTDKWNLDSLASIFHAKLSEAGFVAPVLFTLLDSNGMTLEEFGDETVRGKISADTIPLGYFAKHTLVAWFDFPVLDFCYRQFDRLVIVVSLFILLLFCIATLIRIIQTQRRVARFRDDFMRFVVHDLKSPLNFIRTAEYAIQKQALTPFSESQQQLFRQSKQRLDKLTEAIQQLLTLSVDAYGLKLNKSSFDLKAGIEELIVQHKLSCPAGKRADFLLDVQLPESSMEVDPNHFLHMVENLIDNAVKYSGESVRITITCRAEKNQVALSVKDNGIGIPVADRKNIFKRYYRVKEPGTDKRPGFGLGLNYVWSVVKAHHGTVEVVSEPGKGSEFIIRLPWKRK